MDNPSINIQSKYCKNHNRPIQYYDQNGRNPQCEGCLLEQGKLNAVEQIQKQYQEKIINHNKENDSQLQQLYALRDGILKYKERIVVSLDKSIQQIVDQINNIQSQKQSMQQLDQIMNKFESIDVLTSYLYNNQISNIQFRNQIFMNLLLDFKSNVMKIDFLHSILSQKQEIILQSQGLKQIKISEVIFNEQKRLKKIEYELIQQVKSKELIWDFAIDQKNNILIAGMSEGEIKIYNFQDGKLGAELQCLQSNTNNVFCLYCMKNANSFVSGNDDKSIIIWCRDKDNKWKVQQILNGNNGYVYCIIMNLKEDLLISGSEDSTVKFWRKLTDSWSLSQTVDAGGYVWLLSLNGNEDKLIVCTQSEQIIVMNVQSDQKWKTIQTIKIDQFGFQLCFTFQDQFVFQPATSDYLEVYDFDTNKLQFYQKAKVKVQSIEECAPFFPCQYIHNLNILTVKHGQFVNIFKVDQNGEYQLIQSIKFENDSLFGKMTDDGEQLITWNSKSKEIQVRKLKYKE